MSPEEQLLRERVHFLEREILNWITRIKITSARWNGISSLNKLAREMEEVTGIRGPLVTSREQPQIKGGVNPDRDPNGYR